MIDKLEEMAVAQVIMPLSFEEVYSIGMTAYCMVRADGF